jgi:hypothetical protein
MGRRQARGEVEEDTLIALDVTWSKYKLQRTGITSTMLQHLATRRIGHSLEHRCRTLQSME